MGDAGATAGRVVRFDLFFGDYILVYRIWNYSLQPGHAASNSTSKCRRFWAFTKNHATWYKLLCSYWAYILDFCFSFFWAVPALRPGGIVPHLVPLIWLVILALHLDHSLAKLTATCVLPRNNPKQIQTNPCAISKYWSTTVQDFALKTRIFSAIS